jgi:amidohydrolase
MIASLKKTAGENNVKEIHAVTGAEDFGFYQEKVPGLFFYLGARAPETDPIKVSHHTPDFIIDERAFITGIKAMINVTADYMFMKK